MPHTLALAQRAAAIARNIKSKRWEDTVDVLVTQKNDKLERRLSSRVYLASNDKTAACVLRVGQRELKRREAATLKLLHKQGWPGAPRFLGRWSSGQASCLRVEFVDGDTAMERFLDGPFAMSQLIDFARALARLLRSLHALGIAHLDVKPENIVCRPDGTVALIDWELARQLHDSEPVAFYGTLRYMAPELRCPPLPTRIHAGLDVFSYGATLLALVTGRDVLSSVSSDLFLHPALLAMPGWFVRMLQGALSYDPAARPTMQHICDEYFSLRACPWTDAFAQTVANMALSSVSPRRTEKPAKRDKQRLRATASPLLGTAVSPPLATKQLTSHSEPCFGKLVASRSYIMFPSR